jgi:hypothetical protein
MRAANAHQRYFGPAPAPQLVHDVMTARACANRPKIHNRISGRDWRGAGSVIGDLRGSSLASECDEATKDSSTSLRLSVGLQPQIQLSPSSSATNEENNPVMVRSAVAMLFSVAFSTMALAQAQSQMGTPEQRDACGPDVRRFCHKLKESDGQDAYLQCLELNRSKLSAKCVALLQSYGK